MSQLHKFLHDSTVAIYYVVGSVFKSVRSDKGLREKHFKDMFIHIMAQRSRSAS